MAPREPEKTDKQKFAIEPTIPALPENFSSSEGRPPEPTSSGSLPYVIVALVIAVAAAFFWLSGRKTETAPAAPAPVAPVATKPPPAAKPAPAPAPTPTPAKTPTAEQAAAPAPPVTVEHKKKRHKKAKKAKAVKLPRLPTPPPAD